MKDQIVYLPSAALGIILVVIYSVRCLRNGIPFNVASVVNIVLQSAGVVAGVLLIFSTFSEDLRSKLTGIDLYVLISGIAVFVVSLQGLRRDVWGGEKSND